jgi:ubiquinone/menaquinone biosynthesis C-methylase UbiE
MDRSRGSPSVTIGPVVGRSPRRVLRRTRHAVARRSRPALLAVVAKVLRRLRPGLGTEERLLRWSWESRGAERLDEYLSIGWQNPRINIQSILIRHALLRRLFGSEFEDRMRAELTFAVELNEALRLESVRTGVPINSFLDAKRQGRIRQVEQVIAGREREFEKSWRATLAGQTAAPLSVLELACGSANDYRAFADYGLAPFLTYAGIDLNPKNIANARRRFPDVEFEIGNAMEVRRDNRSVDVVIASDLFEHLPLAGAEKVLGEAIRLARHEVILSFFNMAEIPEHDHRPVGAYHWNLLSRARYEAVLRQAFPSVEVTPIAAWLKREFGYMHTYNPAAYTMVAERPGAAST